MKKFSIPVVWEVWDKVEIEAETIEEAIKKIREDDTISLPTDSEYIDGTFMIYGEEESLTDEHLINYLKDIWDLSGGITGEEI